MLNLLTNYYYYPLNNGKKNLMIESTVKRDMGKQFILCGVIDKSFIRNDDKVKITDFKTGKTIVHNSEFQIDLRLPFYVLLAEQVLGLYNTSNIFS
ncbi:hypothetical protein [Brassicibacter mesophilus]|uniref:hypothetical protein n=1 Tax=Brassicibacter mesophilus TaxID=745119 RepID=UPI003D228002